MQVQKGSIEKEHADISPARIEQRRQIMRLEQFAQVEIEITK